MQELQQVIDEKAELDANLNKLEAFLEGEGFDGLGMKDKTLLEQQAHYMSCYSSVLGERIRRFS